MSDHISCMAWMMTTVHIRTLSFAIPLSASQMCLLGRLLPLMVVQCVPESDEHWKCYLQLLRTVTLVTSHEVTEGAIPVLTLLVSMQLLSEYANLYPGLMVPKLHYMIHPPNQFVSSKYIFLHTHCSKYVYPSL